MGSPADTIVASRRVTITKSRRLMRKYPPSRLAGRSRSLSSRVVRDVTRKPRDWNEATAARSLSASRTPVSSRPSPSQALYAYLGIVVLPYGLPGLHSLCPSAQEQGAQ